VWISAPPTPVRESRHIATFSDSHDLAGVSYVSTAGKHSKGLADIKVVQNWPGPVKDADLAWKTPSRIAYSSENPSLAKSAWGFEVSAKHQAFAWMKLLLDSEQSTKYDDPSLTASEGHGVLRLPSGKTTVDLCADYLTEVAKFAYEELKKEFGPHVVSTSPLEFWFTVPAVWSDRAKADTMRAVKKAANNAEVFEALEVSTYLVPEPEAAAVATISDITQGGSTQQVKVRRCCGDVVQIADHTGAAWRQRPCL
jgi:molecular chaperone DnaK (HSP70)